MRNASKPGHPSKSIAIDFPEWMVRDLERISYKRGMSKETMIKIFIEEKQKEREE